VFSAPAMVPLAFLVGPAHFSDIGLGSWLGLAYVSLFSMLIGFIFWYRGLALGGTASVGQLQLLQPLLGLTIGAVALHERVEPMMVVTTVGVIACVGMARKFA